MIPWLLVLQTICERGKTLSQLVGERMRLFPASGEINRHLQDGCESGARARAEAVREGRAVRRFHRRPVHRVRRLALQPARLEHRAAGAAQRGVARQRGPDARKDAGAAGAAGR